MTKLAFVVPAAGLGKRFDENLPKQYHLVNDLTVIEHTLRVLSEFDLPIVVAIAKDDPYFDKLEYLKTLNIETVVGGETRQASVTNALTYLQQTNKPDWVLVHDAARCCVSVEDIETLIEQCLEHPPGGLLVAPSTDTLKFSDGRVVEETLNREKIYRGLTPQMFVFDELYQAYLQANKEGVSVTDEALCMERAGFKPLLVEGTSANLKVTHPQDLVLAKAIIQEEVVSD